MSGINFLSLTSQISSMSAAVHSAATQKEAHLSEKGFQKIASQGILRSSITRAVCAEDLENMTKKAVKSAEAHKKAFVDEEKSYMNGVGGSLLSLG